MADERPYVMLNAAVTADGKTDTVERRGATISSPLDFERVDRLRAECDAIMVGGRTLLGDDPKLVVKSEALRAERRARGLDENPIKVGVMTNAAVRLDSRFLTVGTARKILFTTTQTEAAQIARLREQGAQVFVMGEQAVDLAAALQHLRQAGVRKLLVEGGGALIAELLRQNLVDEIQLYVAALVFGGAEAPTLVAGPGWTRDAAIPLRLASVERLDEDGIVVRYTLGMR